MAKRKIRKIAAPINRFPAAEDIHGAADRIEGRARVAAFFKSGDGCNLRIEVVPKPLLTPNSCVVGFFKMLTYQLSMLCFFISLRLALERDQRF